MAAIAALIVVMALMSNNRQPGEGVELHMDSYNPEAAGKKGGLFEGFLEGFNKSLTRNKGGRSSRMTDELAKTDLKLRGPEDALHRGGPHGPRRADPPGLRHPLPPLPQPGARLDRYSHRLLRPGILPQVPATPPAQGLQQPAGRHGRPAVERPQGRLLVRPGHGHDREE